MTDPRVRLAVDFGTSTTVAMLQRTDGRVQPLLFDGSPLLQSAVLLGVDGRLHTGRDAAHLARSAPERLEPNPKRRIDDTGVLLGDVEVAVQDLVASVLTRVANEAARVVGPVHELVLTHPANWGAGRRSVLVEAARHIGFPEAELVGEPLAAATYFARTRGRDLPVGACVLVYDLGAGTCDVTLLRHQQDGFTWVASDGLNDIGGLDVDAAVVAFLQATYGELWTNATTRRQLWDDVRSAKEMLSRASGTVVMIPAMGREVPLGREQLEDLARPVLRSTVSMTRAMLTEFGVGSADIAGLFLVGGSSRIPLVATLLHQSLGVAPVVAEQPELVVAEGSLYVKAGPFAPVSGTTASSPESITPPVSAAPVSSGATPMQSWTPYSASPPPVPLAAARATRRSPAFVTAFAVVVVLLLAVGTTAAYIVLGGKGPVGQAGRAEPSGTSSAAGGQPHTTGTGDPGKYDLNKLPEQFCTVVDIGQFAAAYETETTRPIPDRTLTATIGTGTCVMARSHTDAKSKAVVALSLNFRTHVYGDVALAKTYQKTALENAKLNTTATDVPGVGDEAFIHEQKTTAEQQKTAITLIITVRDSNLQWITTLVASRSDAAGWTESQKRDLSSRLVTATKSSLSRTVPILTRQR